MTQLLAQRPQTPQTDQPPCLEDLAYRYGDTYDAYLATEPGREYFSSQGVEGVVAFMRVGKYLKVSGGLLAAPTDRAALLDEFVEYASNHGLVISFFNVTESDLPLFVARGFQATKWGEEAIVDLGPQAWSGKALEWVRRQANYCQRKGLVCSECRPEEMHPATWRALAEELRAVAAQSLADKPQAGEVQFMEGSFDPSDLRGRRMFLARSDGGQGRVEALLVCNPCLNGNQWAFELYRRRLDAVRGTVAFLFHQTMRQMYAEGVDRVSLCLFPGQNCETPHPGDSALIRWGLVIGSRYFNFIFDTAGTAYFKSRFRPRFESRFVCDLPRMTLGSAWAFVSLLGVLRLDARRLGRQIVHRLRHFSARVMEVRTASSAAGNARAASARLEPGCPSTETDNDGHEAHLAKHFD
ncbi:MAG: DUF2156 domain-containing protein [Planctomycetaceae bacterium]